MKAVILHGTSDSHKGNWFPWLKEELEKLGYEVWVPDLPNAKNPNLKIYNEYLLGSGWDFQDNLIIGHSSGAVAVMALLQALPESTKINTAILAGIYKGDLGREDLKGTNIDFNYDKIKQKANQFIFVHSDDDPICPISDAQWIAEQVNGDMQIMHGLKHLNVGLVPSMSEFPELLELIKKRAL